MSRQARLGLLVLVSAVLFVAMLFVLAKRTFLFGEVYALHAQFNHVGGLQAGAEVQYRGIAVGSVEAVTLPTEPGGPITVTMAIQEKARHLVRRDAQAEIKSDGVLGNPLLVLTAGSNTAPVVEEGGTLSGVDPLDVYKVADAALNSVAVFDSVIGSLNQILQEVQTGGGTLGRLIRDPEAYDAIMALTSEAGQTLQTLDAETKKIAGMAAATSEGVNRVLQKVETGDGTVAQFINDRAVYDTVVRTSQQLGTLITRLDTLVTEAEYATHWGRVAMFRAAENMEAVRHNWLLRRYFRDRDPQPAPFGVREQALTESYEALARERQALQQWEQELRALEGRLVRAGVLEAPTLPADSTRAKGRQEK